MSRTRVIFFLGVEIKFNIKIKKMYKYLNKIYIIICQSIRKCKKKSLYNQLKLYFFQKKYCEVISG